MCKTDGFYVEWRRQRWTELARLKKIDAFLILLENDVASCKLSISLS